MTWKEKHNKIIKSKVDIIKEYRAGIPIKKIAKAYGVAGSCIYNNLRLWGIVVEHGIKYLLKEMLLSE